MLAVVGQRALTQWVRVAVRSDLDGGLQRVCQGGTEGMSGFDS